MLVKDAEISKARFAKGVQVRYQVLGDHGIQKAGDFKRENTSWFLEYPFWIFMSENFIQLFFTSLFNIKVTLTYDYGNAVIAQSLILFFLIYFFFLLIRLHYSSR